ncbi:MAG: hypothetical protein ACOC3V_03260 [bacterium]
MLDTKAYLEIKFKGYPIGKKVRCHMWVEGKIKEEDFLNKIEKHLSLVDEFKNEILHEIKIFNLYLTNTKKDYEKYNELVINSTIGAVNLNINNTKNSKKFKNESSSPKNIELYKMKDDDVIKLYERLGEEIIRRRYSLTEEEFSFYKDNEKDFDISDTKELYKKYDGDIIKLRKQRIRKKLEEMI